MWQLALLQSQGRDGFVSWGAAAPGWWLPELPVQGSGVSHFDFIFQQDSNSRYSALSVQHQMLKVGDWDSTAPVELVILGHTACLPSGITAECQGVGSAFL